MNYFDALNHFHIRNDREPTPPEAQLVYFHLLHQFNAQFWRGEVSQSDRWLELKTGLCPEDIIEARRYLKNHGFIDFKYNHRKKNPTVHYTLCEDNFQKNAVTRDQLVQKNFLKSNPSRLSIPSMGGCERERGNAQPPNGRAIAAAAAVGEDDLSKLVAHWRKRRGAALDSDELNAFAGWLARFGLDYLCALIDKAKPQCSDPLGMRFNFFRSFIERQHLSNQERHDALEQQRVFDSLNEEVF